MIFFKQNYFFVLILFLKKALLSSISAVLILMLLFTKVVSKLIQSKVESGSAFQWQSQLRHRWDINQEDCFANICDAEFRYSQ